MTRKSISGDQGTMEEMRQLLGEQFTALRTQIAGSVAGQQADHDNIIRLQSSLESIVSELRQMRTSVDVKHHENQAAYTVLEQRIQTAYTVLEQRIQLNSDTRYKELCDRFMKIEETAQKADDELQELKRSKASLYAGISIIAFVISSVIAFGSKLWK